jgi:broad specificity phosphatase PhoE
MTLLHLIRHGRASALDADYDKLHAMGEAQARLLGEHLARTGRLFDAVYVGPLKRQLDTLRLMREMAEPQGVRWPEAVVHPGLAEGPFELLYKSYLRACLKTDRPLQERLAQMRSAADDGQRQVALEAMFDRMVALWRANAIAGEDLEPAAAFAARVARARDAIGDAVGFGRHVAVVTSNGVIGELLDGVVGREAESAATRHRFYNTSVTLMELTAEGPRLQSRNTTEHITDLALLTLL